MDKAQGEGNENVCMDLTAPVPAPRVIPVTWVHVQLGVNGNSGVNAVQRVAVVREAGDDSAKMATRALAKVNKQTPAHLAPVLLGMTGAIMTDALLPVVKAPDREHDSATMAPTVEVQAVILKRATWGHAQLGHNGITGLSAAPPVAQGPKGEVANAKMATAARVMTKSHAAAMVVRVGVSGVSGVPALGLVVNEDRQTVSVHANMVHVAQVEEATT